MTESFVYRRYDYKITLDLRLPDLKMYTLLRIKPLTVTIFASGTISVIFCPKALKTMIGFSVSAKITFTDPSVCTSVRNELISLSSRVFTSTMFEKSVIFSYFSTLALSRVLSLAFTL